MSCRAPALVALAVALAGMTTPARGAGTVLPTNTLAFVTLDIDVYDSSTPTNIAGSAFAAVNGPLSAHADGMAVTNESGVLIAATGHVAARNFVVRDEGSFMRYVASVTTALAFEREGSDDGDFIRLTANGSTKFYFDILDEPMPVRLDFNTEPVPFLPPGVGYEVEVKDMGADETLYKFPDPDTDPQRFYEDTLPPGSYSVSVSMGRLEEPWTGIATNGIGVMLAVGEIPIATVLPSAGAYSHPDVVTAHDGDGVLAVVNPQILSETDLGNGTNEFTVSASVTNMGGAPWPEVRVELAAAVDGGPDIEVLASFPGFALEPYATNAPPAGSNAVVRVATAEAAALRASILDGSRFRLSGLEQPVFKYPVHPWGPDDMLTHPQNSTGGFDPNEPGFQLGYAPTFGAGTLVVEWEPYFQVPAVTNVVPPEGGAEAVIVVFQNIDRRLPALVQDVVLGEGVTFEVDTFSHFELAGPPTGRLTRLTLADVMLDGVVETPLTFTAHPGDIGVTEIPESHNTGNGLALTGLFPAPVPFHFNNVELSAGITASGSFGFRPELINLALEMRGASVKRLEVRAKYRADCNLLLETEAGADNSGEPIAGREATLLVLPLLQLNLPAGFTFAPRLELTAGALVNAPTSLSLPLTAGLDVDLTAGVRDGAPYYEQDFTSIPLQISDPGFYEALDLEVEAFLDCEIKALIGIADGALNAGPTLGTRAAAVFNVKPLFNPWWRLDAELTLFGGVELDLAGIATVFDAEHDLESWPLADVFPLDSGGPLLSAKSTSVPQPGFAPVGDPRTRWIRSLQPDANGLQGGSGFAVALEGTDDLLAGCGTLNSSVIARFSPEGKLRWAMDPTAQMLASGAVAEPDGGFTVMSGKRNSIRLARFDGNGALVWKRNIAPTGGTLWFENTSFVRRDASGGGSEYFVLGQAIGSSLGGFHASLMKLDDTGAVLWSRIYPVPPFATEGTTATPGALALTADGDVLVAGNTTADVSGTPLDLTNISANGLVFKVDGDTGAVLWSTVIGLINSIAYHAVSEGPDGSVYAGGNSPRGFDSELPSLLLTKLDASGALLDSVLIGSGTVTGAVPHDGETAYDTIHDMAWADGHLWICGQIGLYNAGGGGADGASAFTAMVSEDLDISRFVIHAGPSTDRFGDIEPTANGLFVAGYSESFHPWPGGAGAEGEGTPGALLTAMLPWEGRVRFHASSAGDIPAGLSGSTVQGTHFITPRIRATSQFTIESNQTLFAGAGQINLTDDRSVRPAMVAEDYAATTSDYTLTPVFIVPEEFKSLEFLPESLITDRETFLQWHQVDGTDNTDGDRYDANSEFYLGTDPFSPDLDAVLFEYVPADTNGADRVRYTLTRSILAGSALPEVWSTGNLGAESFAPRPDVNAATLPLDARRDWLFLEIPLAEPRQFFFLDFPE